MVPPSSPYGTLTGQLFLYQSPNLVAFESPADRCSAQNKCILLGGLSDGFLPTPYTEPLEQICQRNDWSLVQPLLSSSYTGFGNGRLDRDVEELDHLLEYLLVHRHGERFAMVGHSTGCQDIVHYLRYGKHASKVVCAVLQAPVSDREHIVDPEAHARHLDQAKQLLEAGKGQEMMPRCAFWAPITAQRYFDLLAVGGMDDYFSSDYTDLELHERLGHVGQLKDTLQCCLVAFSGADEYVPPTLDTERMVNRLVAAMNNSCEEKKPVARAFHISTGNHNLSKASGDLDLFVQEVSKVLDECRR